MGLAVAIFLSSVLLALAALFITTKDRWNWPKIVLYSTFCVVLLAVVVAGSVYTYWVISNRPRVTTEFWEISLGSTRNDVKFLKGEPRPSFPPPTDPLKVTSSDGNTYVFPSKEKADTFRAEILSRRALADERELEFVPETAYSLSKLLVSSIEELWIYRETNPFSGPPGVYFVGFEDDRMRRILYYGSRLYSPKLQGLRTGIGATEVTEKLGQPAHTSMSPDGLRRIFSYPNYNTVFFLEKNEVYAFGIYDPAFDQLEF